MKYICECCNEVFDEEELKCKMEEETGYRYTECPCCGEENTMVEAVQCRECGTWMNKEDAIEDLCEDCAKELLYDDELIKRYIEEACADDFIYYIDSNFTDSTIARALADIFTEELIEFIETDLEQFVEWYNKNV